MTAIAWRDIADLLTGPQVAELARYEHDGEEPSALLFEARHFAEQNLDDLRASWSEPSTASGSPSRRPAARTDTASARTKSSSDMASA
jgi:hypothetical protein